MFRLKGFFRSSLYLSTFVTLLFLSQTGFTAPDAGSLLRQNQQQEQRLRTPIEFPEEIVEKEQQKTDPQDPLRVVINGINLSGEVTAFSRETLLALVEGNIGKALTLDEIKALAQRITRFYQGHGYFLARAYLPPQDITEGIIVIEIQEGLFDGSDNGLSLQGKFVRFDPELIRLIFTTAQPQNVPMQQQKLERAILLVNQFPALSSAVNLEPGSTPGTSKVVMLLREAPAFSLSSAFDNYGNRYTGAERMTVTTALNGVTNYTDQLNLMLNASDRDNNYLILEYNRFLGLNGLQGGVSYSYLNYELGKELSVLDASGSAKDLSFSLQYPLILEQFSRLDLNTDLSFKGLEDQSNGIRTRHREIVVATMGMNYQSNDNVAGGGVNSLDASLVVGDLDLSEIAAVYSADRSGPKKHGGYEKFTFDLSRLQRINDSWSLYIGLNGQLAGKNLDSSEQLQMGGSSGIRAYPVGEGSADEGAKLTIEGRYLVKRNTVLGDLEVIAFIDHAELKQYHNASQLGLTQPNHYSLSGWGIGVNLSKAQRSDISLSWAKKIGKNPIRDPLTGNDSDGKSDDSRLWLTATVKF